MESVALREGAAPPAANAARADVRGHGLRAILRACRILIGCLTAVPVYLRARWQLRGSGTEGRERARGRALRQLCTNLGATFIKVGQIASSRADMLPRPLLEELATLQDQVPPFPFVEVRRTIERELGRPLEEAYDRFDTEAVAAGSVAQVHRAVLRATGDDVAVKVLRPDVARRIQLDRSILLFIARLLERFFPSLRMLSLEGATLEFCRAVEGQLDFVREAESCARMRTEFADDLDVIIPRVFAEASTRSVLTMEWLDGAREEDLGRTAVDVRTLVRTCVRLAARSIFVHGFFHADQHPGNVRFRPPGRVVVFDFGLMADIEERDRIDFARWGLGMATGDGKAVAKMFYDQAPRREVASYEAYEAEITAITRELQPKALGDVQMAGMIGRFLDVLRRHRVQAQSRVTIVYLAMAAIEGLAKRLAPDLKMMEELLPYAAEGLGLVPRSAAKGPPAALTALQAGAPSRSFASGRYRSSRVLGEGARKRVYLARDSSLDRDVAVAVLKADDLDGASLTRFRLEARAMAKLGDHPGIVAVYDFGVEEERPYIVSEHMAGGTLTELLEDREGKPLPIVEALRIAEQVANALEHAHEHGVVHRDLKPGNIWLTGDGVAKLGDFGLSTASDLPRSGENRALIGTVVYMSPEQALGRPADPRSDLYSLGCVLYEMLTGRPPFPGDDAAAIISRHLDTPPAPPSTKNAEITPDLDGLVLGCLAKRPAERPESAAAVAELCAAIVRKRGDGAGASFSDRIESGVFIGRDQELGQLRAGLDSAFAGRGKLFLVAGEPGIGKTRTCSQLAVDARRRGARVLVGRCHEDEGAPAFWPWLQILRGYVVDREAALLDAELGASAGDIAQLVPEIRERLPHVSLVAPQESEAARFRLFDAVTRLLKHAAAANPLVLILDDLHWADKSSLRLLEFLAREISESRILIAATYRDVEVLHGHPLAEILPSLRRSHADERLRLRGLTEGDVRRLLSALSRHEMPAELARTVHRETEGNPFFIEEILSHLIEEGVLRWEGERWVADRRPEEIGLPESVREVIGRRVARLTAPCRRTLTIASVIGREFDLAVLERVTDLGREELGAALGEAAAARVLAELPRAPGRFRFAHALIRETLYGELRTAERVLLHRRIGETLERLHGEASERHLSEIARHFSEAAPGGDVDKAVAYATRAGESASAQLAFDEATRAYEQALKTLDLRNPVDDLQRCRILLKLGETLLAGGEFERSRETFLQAAELADARGDANDLARAAIGYGGSGYVMLEASQPSDRVGALLERALARLGEGDSALRAQLMARLAVTLLLEDLPRRHALAREAFAMAKRVGDKTAIGLVVIAVGWSLWEPDTLEEMREAIAEAMALTRGLGDPTIEFMLEVYRGMGYFESGDFVSSNRIFATATERPAAQQGFLRWPRAYLRGALEMFLGRFEEAENSIAEARRLGEEIGTKDSVVVAAMQLTLLRWLQGRLSAEDVAWISHLPSISAVSFSLLAAIRIFVAPADEAGRSFEDLLRRDFDVGARDSTWLAALFLAAEGAFRIRDVAVARRLREILEPYAGRGSQFVCVWFGSVSRSLGLTATVLGHLDEAARYFEAAIDANARGNGRPWVALTQLDYAGMLAARSAPGDREKARALLAEAIDTASEIGMKKVLADAVALRLELEGIGGRDGGRSIDLVVSSLDARKPDLRPQAAPDGTVTLLFSEMDGFSVMIERLGDRRAHELVGEHNRLVRAELARHGGFEVEVQNDGFLAAFSSAARGLACAVAIQHALAARNAEHAGEAIEVRIGLHTGEVLKEGDRFFGKTVLLAARIASHARGGQILVSSVFRQLVDDGAGARFGEARELELRGLAGRHSVSSILWSGQDDEAESGAAPAPSATPNLFRRSGEIWTIAYEGKSFSLRDAKGLHYIARLLGHPGRELHSLDLAGDGEHVRLGDAEAISDPQAKAAHKVRLAELRSELEEASAQNDTGRADALREEVDLLTRELSSAYGLDGRSRRDADAAERARKAVRSRISDTISRIRKESPALANHLGNSIRVGLFCMYSADNVEWIL